MFSWRATETAKEKHQFLGGSGKQPRKSIVSLAVRSHSQGNTLFFLAANKNCQEIIFFWLFVVTAKETLYSLAAELRLPRKIGAAKVNLDWCSVLGKITSTEDQNV